MQFILKLLQIFIKHIRALTIYIFGSSFSIIVLHYYSSIIFRINAIFALKLQNHIRFQQIYYIIIIRTYPKSKYISLCHLS